MNSTIKGMFLALIIIYIVSPLDLCVGPIDDIIVLLMAIASQKNN